MMLKRHWFFPLVGLLLSALIALPSFAAPYGYRYLHGSSNPGESLLSTAIARYDKTTIIGTNPVTEWQNRGTGGSAYDLDVVVGTGANLIVLESGVGWLTGTSGNYFSTPDSVPASITSSITLIVYVAPVSWTATQAIIAKGGSYIWFLQAGIPKLVIYDSGATPHQSNATSAVGFAAGTGYWVRVTWDNAVDTVNFFTADVSPLSIPTLGDWTLLGDPDVALVSANIKDNTVSIEVGSQSSGNTNRLLGKVYRAHIIAGTDPTVTPAVNFDARDASVNTATWPASISGETWTARGDAFVNATRHTGIYSRGSVGLETTAGQSITGTGITVYAVFKPTLASPGADQFIFDSRSTAGSSLSLRSDESNADKYTLNQGSDIALSQAYDNDLQVYTAQFFGNASTKLTASAGSVTGNAGSENWDFGSILMALGGGSTAQGLLSELVIFDTAHSAVEIAIVQEHYARRFQ